MRIVQPVVLSSTKNQRQNEPYYLIALGVFCAIVFFYALGRLPFIGPDEPRYAQVAREMYDSGDWVTPRLGGLHWFEKPALSYWLLGAGFALFGQNEFGARFWNAVIASLGALLLYWFGKQIRSPRYGYLSAATLITCGLWPGFARGATFDLPLSVALELALLSFYIWESRERSEGRHRLWYLFCFALGMAVLAKGLVGVLLPAIIIGPYLLVTKRWQGIFTMRRLAAGGLLFLLTIAVWYGPVIAVNGWAFINEFIIGHHFARYLSNRYRHPGPVYFFPLVLLAGSFPWTCYLVSSLWRMIRSGRRWAENHLHVLLLFWLAAPLVFFSFSGSKLPGYILPVFPAVALMVGEQLEKWWEGPTEAAPKKWIEMLTALLLALVGVATVVVGTRELGATRADVLRVSAVGVGVAVVYLALLFVRNARAATLFLPAGLCFLVIAAAQWLFPALGNRESFRDMAMLASQAARPGERLVFFITADNGVNFYATGLPLRDIQSELVTLFSSQEIATLAKGSRSQSILVASRSRWVPDVENPEFLMVEKLGEQKFNARCSPDCDWVLLRAQTK
jgi:4-amino-4-deoxy-L-arabinose transferase-like glycosyltransferase